MGDQILVSGDMADRLTKALNKFANTVHRAVDGTERSPPRLSRRRTRGKRLPGSHLYLVEFVGHCVKVGVSTEPKIRIANHIADGRNFGREVGRVWVSYRHREALGNECTIRGESPTEYLARDFDVVIEQALALPMTRVEASL